MVHPTQRESCSRRCAPSIWQTNWGQLGRLDDAGRQAGGSIAIGMAMAASNGTPQRQGKKDSYQQRIRPNPSPDITVPPSRLHNRLQAHQPCSQPARDLLDYPQTSTHEPTSILTIFIPLRSVLKPSSPTPPSESAFVYSSSRTASVLLLS